MTIASRNYYASEIYETVPKLHCKVGNFTHIINTKTVTRNNAKNDDIFRVGGSYSSHDHSAFITMCFVECRQISFFFQIAAILQKHDDSNEIEHYTNIY